MFPTNAPQFLVLLLSQNRIHNGHILLILNRKITARLLEVLNEIATARAHPTTSRLLLTLRAAWRQIVERSVAVLRLDVRIGSQLEQALRGLERIQNNGHVQGRLAVYVLSVQYRVVHDQELDCRILR